MRGWQGEKRIVAVGSRFQTTTEVEENRRKKSQYENKMEKTVFNNAVDVVVVAATVDIYWCCFLSSLIYHSEGISYIAATFVS